MLTTLLPGLREVRSALVAGYMWFCASWLLVGHFWPDTLKKALLAEPAKKLLANFGTSGQVIAISIACLLIGEATSSAVQHTFFKVSRQYMANITPENFIELPFAGRFRDRFRPMSMRSINRVYARVIRGYQDRVASSPNAIYDSTEANQLAIATLREVLFVAPRLILAKPELYIEHDRLRSESEFRDAIFFPLPALAVALALNVDVPLWVKVVGIAAICWIDVQLFLQSRTQFRIAFSMIAHSVADGTIRTASSDD